MNVQKRNSDTWGQDKTTDNISFIISRLCPHNLPFDCELVKQKHIRWKSKTGHPDICIMIQRVLGVASSIFEMTSRNTQ